MSTCCEFDISFKSRWALLITYFSCHCKDYSIRNILSLVHMLQQSWNLNQLIQNLKTILAMATYPKCICPTLTTFPLLFCNKHTIMPNQNYICTLKDQNSQVMHVTLILTSMYTLYILCLYFVHHSKHGISQVQYTHMLSQAQLIFITSLMEIKFMGYAYHTKFYIHIPFTS